MHAVQLAASYGAEVTAVCSAAKADLVRSLGAHRVIDYAREQVGTDGARYDVVLDIAGNRPVSLLRRALTRSGTVVIVGGEHGGRWLGGVHRQLWATGLSTVARQRLTTLVSRERGPDFAALADLVEHGDLRPVLDRTYTLDEAAKAIDHLAAGHVRGKVALTL